MSRPILIAATAALILTAGLVAACSGAPSSDVTGTTPAVTAPTLTTTQTAGTSVRIVTDKGEVTIALNTAKAPQTAANFAKLVQSGFYNGLRVHRVEAGFVVQAGDPLTKGLSAKALLAVLARRQAGTSKASDPAVGTGGPGWSVPFEENDLLHDRGVIAMARSSDPDSAGSQFYITLAPAHFLDGDYVVFGNVTQGMDVVDRLAVGDAILSATVIKD